MFARRAAWLAAGGSFALLAVAFAFQHLGELHPCKMCIWQRWPHAAAVGIGLALVFIPSKTLMVLGAVATLITAAIGAFHTGVERGWWEGPSSCSASEISDLNVDDLYNQIMQAPVVRCDEVAWQMMGLSMASWNMLASFALVAIWLFAAFSNRDET